MATFACFWRLKSIRPKPKVAGVRLISRTSGTTERRINGAASHKHVRARVGWTSNDVSRHAANRADLRQRGAIVFSRLIYRGIRLGERVEGLPDTRDTIPRYEFRDRRRP